MIQVPIVVEVVQLFRCSVVQLFSCSVVQMFSCSVVQLFSRSFVQMFICSDVHLFRCSVVQLFRCSVVQLNDVLESPVLIELWKHVDSRGRMRVVCKNHALSGMVHSIIKLRSTM